MNLHTWSASNCSRALCVVAAALALSADGARASFISFETTPSGATPVDNSDLSDPYLLSGGGDIRFFVDTNSNGVFDVGTDVLPRFEQVGDDTGNGFTSAFNGNTDTARPGYEAQLGDFFLRVPVGTSTSAPLLIRYSTLQSVRAFSGELWDIDGDGTGTEQWQVDALGPFNLVMQTLYSPVGVDHGAGSLDSLPWTFAFSNLPDDVTAVRLTFIGTKPTFGGFGLNNFSALEAVPEPSTVLFGLALTGLCACDRRRRRATLAA